MQKQWLKKQNIETRAYSQYMPSFICANSAIKTDETDLFTLVLGLDHSEPAKGRLRYGP